MKVCSKCGLEKEITEYWKHKKTVDGIDYYCKDCRKNINNEYSQNNRNAVAERTKRYKANNRLTVTNRNREYKKNRRDTDPTYKLVLSVRSRIKSAINRNSKSNRSLKLLGCSASFYREYLEMQFTKEMNWENHGTYWEIDHVIPCASFDLSIPEQQAICFHYTNTQPLEKRMNLKKLDLCLDENYQWVS
jgi:hypothetical protein